ncbi:hypothetical protein ACHAXT_012152 [Thalassiosira profunda]
MASSFCQPDAAPAADVDLDASAQAFLDHLRLPRVHPLCREGHDNSAAAAPTNEADELAYIGGGVFELPHVTFPANGTASTLGAMHLQQQQPPLPEVASMSLLQLHDHSAWELMLTAATMSAPTLAMMELWLRFFAVFLAPLCLAWMLHRLIATSKSSRRDASREAKEKENGRAVAICTVGLASSAVLFTDSLYVFEYGRWFGFSLFALTFILSIRCAASMERFNNEKSTGRRWAADKKSLLQSAICVFGVTTTVVFLRSDGGHMMDTALQRLSPAKAVKADSSDASYMPHPGLDLPTIDPGLYYSSSNSFVSSIVSHWPESGRTYNVENGATPYLVNGDQRTGIPFIVNKVEEQEYVRVWVQNRYDGEHLALDVAFPYSDDGDAQRSFVHDLSKPVYLVLHGLNGGSHEEYVKDLVKRRRAEGSTVVVLIARGMMDTQLSSWNCFHGARTGDVDIAARSLRRGLTSLAEAHKLPQRQLLAGVGYSMGAIILSNYVARSGEHCALDAAMAVSGGLDMRQQLNFRRSMRLWQPMLTMNLREDILIGKYARHYKHRLTEEQFLNMLRVTSISALDVEAIVTYNSFESLVHYYSEMSAMGDREPEFDLFGSKSAPSWGRIANVSVPFAVLQALDDPLVGWRTIGTENPQSLADSGNGNVMLLLTKAGGHVGWPLGTNPKKSGWMWMSNAVRDFALAVDKARELPN